MTEKNRSMVLIVDDAPENLDVLCGILSDEYEIKAATNGERALKIAQKYRPDLLLLDIMMPGMDGYEVCARLKKDPRTKAIPVIFVTAKCEIEDEVRGFELGGVDYITKPVSPPIVQHRVKTQLALYDQKRTLAKMVIARTKQLEESQREVIARLGRAAEFKDNDTSMHVLRVGHYARLIAEKAGMDEDTLEMLFQAAGLHDLGKVGLSDQILLHKGKLDAHQRELMQQHCQFGADIIGDPKENALLAMVKDISLGHHEKWDGSGYPNGVSAKSIPLVARIVAIADVFDALTSDRLYREGWETDKAKALIEQQAGIHFDPELVAIFMARFTEILDIKERFQDISGFASVELQDLGVQMMV